MPWALGGPDKIGDEAPARQGAVGIDCQSLGSASESLQASLSRLKENGSFCAAGAARTLCPTANR